MGENVVGDLLGLALGLSVEVSVGDRLWLAVGLAVGLSVVDLLRLAVGLAVGDRLGLAVACLDVFVRLVKGFLLFHGTEVK